MELVGDAQSVIISNILEYIKYSSVKYKGGGLSGAGAIYVDDELYIPNLVRAVLCLSRGGTVTISDPLEELEE